MADNINTKLIHLRDRFEMEEELRRMGESTAEEDAYTLQMKKRFNIPRRFRMTLRCTTRDDFDEDNGLHPIYRPTPWSYKISHSELKMCIRCDSLKEANSGPPNGYTCRGPSLFHITEWKATPEGGHVDSRCNNNIHYVMKAEIYWHHQSIKDAVDALICHAIPVLVAHKPKNCYFEMWHFDEGLMDDLFNAYSKCEDDIIAIMEKHGQGRLAPRASKPLYQQRIENGYNEYNDIDGSSLKELIFTALIPGAVAVKVYNNFTFRPQRLFFLPSNGVMRYGWHPARPSDMSSVELYYWQNNKNHEEPPRWNAI